MLFQELWRINDDNLAIALHHGSLDVAQRRKVEDAMAAGRLRAVVCTSSLDLGIDWGDVDLVINVGAPKGSSRLLQRIGRANHRLDEPSRGVLVPANRFEVLECRAAIDAVADNAQDTPPLRTGALDVLAQHVLGRACGEPFLADELLRRSAHGRALRGAHARGFRRGARFRRDRRLCAQEPTSASPRSGRARTAAGASRNPRVAQHYRLNVGTIVEADMLKVRLVRSRGAGGGYAGGVARGGRLLGEIEEYFIETLTPGDTFVFAGEVLRYEAMVEDEVYVSRASVRRPEGAVLRGRQVPALDLSRRARARRSSPTRRSGARCRDQVREWLDIQQLALAPAGGRATSWSRPSRAPTRHYLVCYPFEGRLAHQTLGMLLTRRLERARLRPLGFVANEYALAVWGLGDVALRIARGELSLDAAVRRGHAGRRPRSLARGIGADEAHLPHLRDHRRPDRAALSRARRRSRRQVTISTDLVYDVLRRHQPDHVLLRAARGRRRDRTARHPPARRDALAHPGPNHP